MKFEFNHLEKSVLDSLSKKGRVYLVGGIVRDMVMYQKVDYHDVDVEIYDLEIDEIIDILSQYGKVNEVGKSFGILKLDCLPNFDFALPRIERKKGQTHREFEVEVHKNLDMKIACRRRDFTINAMAYNDSTGLVDEFDGINDLNKGIIRCVGDAKERFTEDALRMMRAIRFSAQLGFDIEENTYNAISKLSPSISHVSMERIQVELVKTLLSDTPGYVMRFYETGLFKYVLPDIGRVLGGRYSRNALTMLKFSKKQPVFRYAALLNTLEPENVRKTLRELKLDNYTVEHVTKLVANSKVTIEENEPALREAVHQYGRELIQMMFEHEEAIIATKEEITGIKLAGKKKHLIVLRTMYDEITKRGDCICIKDLDITGNDLMEYGLKGPEIGKTLNELLGVVIENPRLNDKATLIALIEHLN